MQCLADFSVQALPTSLISVMLTAILEQTAKVTLLIRVQKNRNAPLLDRQKAEQDCP